MWFTDIPIFRVSACSRIWRSHLNKRNGQGAITCVSSLLQLAYRFIRVRWTSFVLFVHWRIVLYTTTVRLACLWHGQCFFTLLGDASMLSMLDLPKEEAYALSMVNPYCTSKEDKRGNAISNMKKMSLCRAEWKKVAIEANFRMLAVGRPIIGCWRITQRMHAIYKHTLLCLLAKRRTVFISKRRISYCMSTE